MANQNILLGAVELGLGTNLRTGAVFNDPAVRAACTVRAGTLASWSSIPQSARVPCAAVGFSVHCVGAAPAASPPTSLTHGAGSREPAGVILSAP